MKINDTMLISTKINVPQLKPSLLYRNHLIGRLAAISRGRFVLITGPAGYGKTSLAGQWINRDNLHVAWYSIDEAENDLDLFFRYFMAALINKNNALETKLGPLLHDRHSLRADDVIPAIIQSLSDLAEDMVVVLDDYHLITNDVVHHAIGRLLEYFPAGIHLVIISRHRLPKPLQRAKYHCDMVEITPEDLKFSENEAQYFFKHVIPLELTHQEIRELTQFTGGWVTGLQIYGLS